MSHEREHSKKLIQLTPDLAIQPCHVAAVRRVDDSDEQCVVWMVGQSAVDGGFLVERGFDEVMDELDEALGGEAGEDDEDGEDRET